MNTDAAQLDAVDIAIVGGGMVGVPLAIMLSRKGWRVALVEQHEPQASAKPSPANDADSVDTFAGVNSVITDVNHPLLNQRCTALSAACQQLFAEQQLWSYIAPNACPIEQVHVSHQGYFGSTRLKAEQYGVSALGYVVNNNTMLQNLREALVQSEVISLSGYEAIAYNLSENAAQLSLKKNQQHYRLQTKLAVAVDGVSSFIRQAAGIAVDHHDYDQVAILGSVQLSSPHKHIAYERFTPSGPLAMLPRPSGIASFVWCIEPEQRASLEALSHAEFLHAIQQQFGFRLGRFHAVGPRQFIPLIRTEARAQISERLVLLGNAARLLHPVAGQGYNLAMRDVAALTQALNTVKLATQNLPLDPAEPTRLQEFAASRQPDQKNVVQLTDALARSFRGRASLPAHVRSLGLLGLELTPALKQKFARQTMGFR